MNASTGIRSRGGRSGWGRTVSTSAVRSAYSRSLKNRRGGTLCRRSPTARRVASFHDGESHFSSTS